jgi:solute carrier family 13 (sodium-dependent dicarboxylate transporter), member 2/3/5
MTGTGNVIGNFICRMASNSRNFEKRVLAMIIITGAAFSSLLPNTATTVAMLPAVNAISSSTRTGKKKLYLATAISTNLGGMVTLIGTTTNITAKAALDNAGVKSFGFFDFTLIGLPVAIACILFLLLMPKKMYPSEEQKAAVSQFVIPEKTPLKGKQFIVLFLFVIFVISIILENVIGIPAYIVSAVIATIMVAVRLIDEKKAILAMDLSTTIFISSCLAFSAAFVNAGGATAITKLVSGLLTENTCTFVILSVIFWACCILTQFISNTAAASISIPLIVTIAIELGADPRSATMVAVVACNCSYLSPIASPPNILVSAQSGLKFTDWLRIGAPLTLIYFVLCITLLPILWPLY